MEGVPVGVDRTVAFALAAAEPGFDDRGVRTLLDAAEGGMLAGIQIARDAEKAKNG